MKKRIIIIIGILLAIVLTGCATNLVGNQKLSELRTDILVGEDDTYQIVAVTGVREDPFNIDGVSQPQKAYFTVITVTPAAYNPIAEYTFSVTVAGKLCTGKLVKHPFNKTYSTEINALNTDSQLSVTISGEGSDAVIVVKSVKTENFIDENKAFSIAEKKLKDKVAGKECDYELFVRLIENPINADGGYYWYIAYMFDDDSTCAVLIDPVTMEIVAIKD